MAKTLKELSHVKKLVPNGGGEVYILDNGAIINSEGEAMLQALHSRSVGGFESHLEALEKRGADNFMKNFYVGYGHKSIGDCGDTTIFVEGVSMLAAKAIQDFKLYSGQEASTRYIDFSEQKFASPHNTTQGNELLEFQRSFYLDAVGPVTDQAIKQFPQKKDEKDSDYRKAIEAHTFDMIRGFLPAGATTNLAWHSNLRQVSDKLLFLHHHPLEEVRRVGETIKEAILEYHPNSFSRKTYAETEEYQDLIAKHYFYHNSASSEEVTNTNQIDLKEFEKYRELFEKRPVKTELPKFLSHLGTMHSEFHLDYGSFRDLQRHRALDQRMPLLTTDLGFNSWYLNELPEEVKSRIPSFIEHVESELSSLESTIEDKQYYTPMGYNTANYITGDLPAMAYMVELRATRFVHPTLRRVAQTIGQYMQDELEVPIHFDSEPDRFDVKRGTQTVEIK